jgi:DNA-binding CsgD family transcriptional regulator
LEAPVTTKPDHSSGFGADRLLETLERVLAIDELDLRGALSGACTHVAEALGADKVDLFIYEAESEVMVALGTSDTETGHRQHRIGMHRQPLANGGIAVRVFRNGEAYHTGSANNDPEQLRGMVEGLGVRSEIAVPLEVQGERRGVLSAVSLRPEAFADADLQFLMAVSRWIGLVLHRTELFEQATRDAAGRGRREAADELARLTRRQQEIAAAIAEGLSNDEIAEQLVLEKGTVANHVAAILSRLDLRNRTQIGVWASEHGLYRSDQEQQVEEEPGGGMRWLGSSIRRQLRRNATGDNAADINGGA